jgi:sialate O-acetylesterase
MLTFYSGFRLCQKLAGLILLCAFVPATLADVQLPRLLTDGAILQRDKPVTIWGWADEGESVTVEFAGKKLSTTAKDGRWSLKFPALKAGGPYDIKVTGKNQLHVKDILMGDLWIGAGQSNMELPLRRVATRYPDVISQTQLPQIREFSVPVTYTFKANAEDYTQGQWKTATPENLANFSAVGFFFAQQVHTQNHVPVGLLSISVGGSPAEAWMSETALEKYPHYLEVANKFKDDTVLQQTIAQDKANSNAWYAKASAEDIGSTQKQPWSSPAQATDDWQTITVPGFLREQGIDFDNGVVWFKKTIELTDAQAQQDARLWLGAIVDGDEAYINGTAVGQTGYRYPPRIYSVPKNVLKPGKNDISLRVTSYSGDAGFVKDKLYALEIGDTKINLEGEWKYKIGMRAAAMAPSTTIHYLPTSLFKAKLAPAFPLNIKGVIWAQGESNVTRAEEYKTLFPDLITDWRNQFNQGDFPFIFVQLANFLEPQTEPGESEWAMAREAQRQALSLPNTAMAVAIDIGEWNDIHPLNKQDVGKRLALAAQKIAYGDKSVLASGPQVKSVKRKGNQLVITFDHVGKGLHAKAAEAVAGKVAGKKSAQKELAEFAIAGADKKFVWAKAIIKGKRVIVSSDSVTDPVWVRYAWADNPEGANLYNSADLPASPFEARVIQQ